MRSRQGLLLALITAAVLAYTCFSGWAYVDAAGSDDLDYGRQRDAALDAGRAHIERLNSIDAKDAPADLRGWLRATTGGLHEELRRTSAKKPGTSARATVTDAAVTELDARAGTAKVLATVRIELSRGDQERKRFEAGLARTGDGWKVASLTAVTVRKETA